MASTRAKALVAFVVVLAFLQVAFEDIVVFLGATGGIPAGVTRSPAAMVAVPLLISTLLLVALVGGALLHTDTLR